MNSFEIFISKSAYYTRIICVKPLIFRVDFSHAVSRAISSESGEHARVVKSVNESHICAKV